MHKPSSKHCKHMQSYKVNHHRHTQHTCSTRLASLGRPCGSHSSSNGGQALLAWRQCLSQLCLCDNDRQARLVGMNLQEVQDA